MPDLTISTGGDLTVGGSVSGRDQHHRVTEAATLSEREIADIRSDVGKLQSDMVTVRLELAAMRERMLFIVIGFVLLLILSGVSVVASVVQ